MVQFIADTAARGVDCKCVATESMNHASDVYAPAARVSPDRAASQLVRWNELIDMRRDVECGVGCESDDFCHAITKFREGSARQMRQTQSERGFESITERTDKATTSPTPMDDHIRHRFGDATRARETMALTCVNTQ